jgi:putative membrane protein
VGIPVTTTQLLHQAWDFEPSIIVGCALLPVAYLAFVRPLAASRFGFFTGGALLLFLTLTGPLDYLGDSYLFSAHMLEHLLLILAVPPLLLLGIPEPAVRRLLAHSRVVAVTERVLGRPFVAWLLAMGTLYAWHAPALYNAALADERIHALEHLSFLVTATIFWWPVLSPLPEHRLTGPVAIAYLFLASIGNDVLGVLLTFAPPGLYPLYTRSAGSSATLAFIRNDWGLDPKADQQLGGLLMWVVGMLFFLWAILAAYGRWYVKSGAEGVP